MNIRTFMNIFVITLIATAMSSVAIAGNSLKLKVSDNNPDIRAGDTQSFVLRDDRNVCSSSLIFSVVGSAPAGTLTLDPGFSTNGQFTFSNDGNGAGYLTTDKNDYKFEFSATCTAGSHGGDTDTEWFKPEDSNAGSTPPPPPPPPPAGVLSLSLSPNTTTMTLSDNGSASWTASGGNGTTCPGTNPYVYTLVASPTHGTVTLDPGFTNNGQFTYMNNDTGNGYLGATSETLTISVACGTDTPASQDIQLRKTPTIVCTGSNTTGVVIMDNTATPGQASIASNLAFLDGCSKSDTTIDDGYGGNAINITNYQTVNRDISAAPHTLDLVVGRSAATVDDLNFNTTDQLAFFADGTHLFDLDRLRAVADWISATGNVTPDTGVAANTYGTISFSQFLSNIANARTMYGMVRVLIPLEKGARSCSGADCTKNAVGQTVASAADLYGFCSGTTAGLCTCAPTSGTNLKSGNSYCGSAITSTSRIKVKGSLLWDFVDHLTGAPIPLAELPFAPRELYFKVSVPIMVNWDYDATGDGTMDNMFIVKAVTNGLTSGPVTPVPSIDFLDIPQSSKDNYLFETGTVLDATEFATLNEPNKYHMLMASGYADGWAEAFNKLNITAATWGTLPMAADCANYTSTTCSSSQLGVPSSVSGVMTANDVRSEQFEDLPTYLYSGGLIDMHGHVNISGLLYVPQAMELEAKDSAAPSQQYISGAIVVRDGFYIEAKDNTITVISSDPNSYSTARTNGSAVTTPSLNFSGIGPGLVNSNTPSTPPASPPPGGADTSCIGCGGATGGGGGGGAANVGNPRWIEVRPAAN